MSGLSDGFRFVTVDGQFGAGQHADVTAECSLGTASADLPVLTGQAHGRRLQAGGQRVQEAVGRSAPVPWEADSDTGWSHPSLTEQLDMCL